MKTDQHLVRLAGCVIQDEKGRILLLHRYKDGRDQWEIPGGKIDKNEKQESTAVREVKEEAGIDVKIVRLLGQKDFKERDRNLHYTWYLAKVVDGKAKIGEPDVFDDAQYFSIEEMRKLKLSEGAKTFLDLVDARLIKL